MLGAVCQAGLSTNTGYRSVPILNHPDATIGMGLQMFGLLTLETGTGSAPTRGAHKKPPAKPEAMKAYELGPQLAGGDLTRHGVGMLEFRPPTLRGDERS